MWFERTLVLLCQHDSDGAMGLIINRENQITIRDVVDSLQPDHSNLPSIPDAVRPTWWGGPIGDGTGFVVWNGQVNNDEGWNIGPTVAVSPSIDRLISLIEANQDFQMCLGYAGWGPGQLDEEIRQGAWLVVDVDEEIVFNTPLTERYDSALAVLGLSPHTVWMQPINE